MSYDEIYRDQIVQGYLVLPGGVSFIAGPVVSWKLYMKFFHMIIPVGFCQYTGSCYGSVNSIALNDAFMRYFFKSYKTVTIDQ